MIYIDKLKELFWLIATGVMSVLSPVQNVLSLLFLSFIFNIIVGIITDVHANRKKFKIKKAFNAITQLMFYSACVVFLDAGSRLLEEDDLGILAIKWTTYVVVYFYLTNIFRNAKQIYPKSEAIALIYEILSTEIFDRLKEMIGIRKKKEETNEENN